MKAIRVLLVFCLLACCGATPLLAGPITNLVVFGDSLSDAGNAFLGSGGTIPPAPYFNGRFSNGPVWVEQLAAELGLPPLLPSLAGGSDYAFGGAQTGGGNSALYNTPNIDTQIAMYLGAGHVPTDSDLFVLWAGANDVFLGVMTSSRPVDPAAYALNMRNSIETLHAAGAKRFLVVNMPNLAYTPWFRSLHLQTLGAGVSQQFNAILAAQIDSFAPHSDMTIHELDAYGLFAQVMLDPGAAGLTNVMDPALDETTGVVAPNPNEHLFWDSVHPTATVHALLAQEAATLVPEPASVVLLVTGGLFLAVFAMRRRVGSRVR